MIKLNDLSSFLDSPIQTLIESIQDPIHEYITIPDLVEAYNIFSIRLRNIITRADTFNSPPYTTLLELNSAVFTDVICRDISCILPDSFAPRPESYLDQSYFNDDSSNLIDDSEGDVENNMLSCQALRAAADICAIPPVLASLTDLERSRLMNAIFEVSCFPKSPIYNWNKINSLVVSLFKFQRLHWDTMRTRQREICILIQERLQHTSPQHRADAVIIIRSMLTRYPKLVKGFTSEFLPTVLEQLMDPSSNARVQAVSALAAFALLKVKSDVTCYPEQEIRQALQTFIAKYMDKRRRRCNRISAMLNSALGEEEVWNGKGLAFAIVFASSIMLVQDHTFFSSPQSMTLVYQVISKLRIHPYPNAVRAHMELSRLSIWAFSKMPPPSDPSKDEISGIWDRAYLILKQFLNHGLGIQLVHVLMKNAEELSNQELMRAVVGKAVLLVEEMVQHTEPSVRTDGFKALCALLKGVGPSFDIAPHCPQETSQAGVVFSIALLDGSLLEQNHFQKCKLHRTHVDVDVINPLPEQGHVVDHWDKLADIWVTSANGVIQGKHDFTPDYIRSWHALLLVQTQLTQGNEHLAPSPSFCNKVASILGRFVVQDDSIDVQGKSLSLIFKLWNTMKNTFAHEWLSSAAEVIITSLLSKSFSVDQQMIQDLWTKLCADLIAVGIPTLLHVLHARAAVNEEAGMTRLLWCMLAKGGKLPFEDDDWSGMVHFLSMPFGAWELSDEESGVWQTLLQSALRIAEKCGQTSNHVVDQLCSNLNEGKQQGLQQSTNALYFIISKVTFPPPGLIKLINGALVLNYSPQLERKAFGLKVLRLLGRMVKTVETGNVVAFLEVIQDSSLVWIRDRDHILAAHEHEEMMVTFYAHCLDSLAKDMPSASSLVRLEPTILGCFDSMDPVGLDIFAKFWRATYHQHPTILPAHFPQRLRICLQAWNDVFDESLGFSLDPNSIPHDSSPRDSRSLGSIRDVNEQVDSTFLFEQEPSVLLEPANGFNRSGTVTPTQSRVGRIDKTFSERKSALDVRIHELDEETSQGQDMAAAGAQSPTKEGRLDESSRSDKREAEGQDISPAPKRRKTSPECIPFFLTRPNLSTSRSVPANGQEFTTQRLVSNARRSVSSGEPSTSTTPSWLRSQNNMTHAMSRIGELAQVDNEVLSQRDRISSDDYDSWEQPVSVGDLREVKAEMASSDDVVPDSEEAMMPEDEELPMKYSNDDDAEGHLGSPFDDHNLVRSRKRERSQTAPEPGLMSTAQLGDSPDRPQSLRRNHTAGGPFQNKKSTSAQQLQVLNATYAALSTARESQIDDEDIIRAKEVTSNINLLLEQRILARLGRGSKKG